MSDITNTECRHVTHIPEVRGYRDDVNLCKLLHHHVDGSTSTEMKMIRNYQRPFQVTKPPYRNHKQSKETEDLSKVTEHWSTQSKLRDSVAAALGQEWKKGHLRMLSDSPYLYGSDVHVETVIKEGYDRASGNINTPYSYCAYDTENNVLTDDPFIEVASVAMGKKVYVSTMKKFLQGIDNPMEKLNAALVKYLGKYVDDGLEVEFDICDDETGVIKNPIAKAHEWQPDIMGIWSISHDVPLVEDRCHVHGINPKDVWSDPSIPPEYRVYKFNKGRTQSVTASGVYKALEPSQQWHTVTSTSSFVLIDHMSTFRELRSQEQNRKSFGLDAILQEVLGERKLRFKEADQYKYLDWHIFMQKNYPIEYVIYNVFDTYGMVLLEEETKDMGVKVPLGMKHTPIKYLPKRTKRIDDVLEFFNRKNNEVTGTVAFSKEEDKSLDLRGWIVTAPAELRDDNGLRCLRENRMLPSNLLVYVSDVDITSSYPTTIQHLGISKRTTALEVISISNHKSRNFRFSNINSMHGHVNAIDYCTKMYNYPTLDGLQSMFLEDRI